MKKTPLQLNISMSGFELRRAFLFGVFVYLSSFVLFGILSYFPEFKNPLYRYITNWIVTIPLILIWCKWYFQSVVPSWYKGLCIGIMPVLVGLIIDALFFVLYVAEGNSTEVFVSTYSDWKTYLSLLEVLVITTYAGYEFDAPVIKKLYPAIKSTKKGKRSLTKKKK